MNRCVPEHRRAYPHGRAHSIGGVEQAFLVLLQVAIVGHRQTLKQCQQGDQIADHATGLAARQLGHIGILLLRHQRGAGGVGVGDTDKVELAAGPQDQVFRQARQVYGQQRGDTAKLHDEIPVADRVHRVLRQARLPARINEPEQLCHQLALERQRRAGQRAAAQRTHIEPGQGFIQPLVVALQHLDISQQMMRQVNRLGTLQMGVTRNDHFTAAPAQFNQGALQRLNLPGQRDGLLAQPKPHVERDLVIARATGVEFGARCHPARQRRLDVHVHVLQLRPPVKSPGRDLSRDGVQPFDNRAQLRPGQQPGFPEHSRMGYRARDVVPPEPPIEGNGLSELRHGRRRAAPKPSAARNESGLLHAFQSGRMCAASGAKSRRNEKRIVVGCPV